MKKYLKENKTLLILMIVAITCIVISSVLLLKYFYFGNGGSKYGARLDGIENVKITNDRQNEIVDAIKASENVVDSNISINGKIINTRIVFNENATIDYAKEVANSVLEKYSDEEKNFYDFQFTLKLSETQSKDCPTLMGSKNVKGVGLVWNNCNPAKDSSEN